MSDLYTEDDVQAAVTAILGTYIGEVGEDDRRNAVEDATIVLDTVAHAIAARVLRNLAVSMRRELADLIEEGARVRITDVAEDIETRADRIEALTPTP